MFQCYPRFYPIREVKIYSHLNLESLDTQTAIFIETTEAGTSVEDLKRKHPFNGPGKPEDIAKMAVVLASDDASWVTGVSWPVDGGYTAR